MGHPHLRTPIAWGTHVPEHPYTQAPILMGSSSTCTPIPTENPIHEHPCPRTPMSMGICTHMHPWLRGLRAHAHSWGPHTPLTPSPPAPLGAHLAEEVLAVDLGRVVALQPGPGAGCWGQGGLGCPAQLVVGALDPVAPELRQQDEGERPLPAQHLHPQPRWVPQPPPSMPPPSCSPTPGTLPGGWGGEQPRYLVHAGVGDVILFCLQDNGEGGEGHAGTYGCCSGTHPSDAYLERGGRGVALLGHPAALREAGAVGAPHPFPGVGMGTLGCPPRASPVTAGEHLRGLTSGWGGRGSGGARWGHV